MPFTLHQRFDFAMVFAQINLGDVRHIHMNVTNMDVKKLTNEPHTVQTFSSHFLDGICKLLKCNVEQSYELALIYDTIFFELLPENLASLIEDSAIRFAFTNWNSGVKDLYFCGFFNPRTQKVSFGLIEEDKTNLQPMDEKAWINDKAWDVDPRPYAAKKLAI